MTVPKSELIALLDFPRRKMLAMMELGECPHNGFFDLSDLRCQTCHQGSECRWVNHNDQCVDLDSKTLEDLQQQILKAADFIDASLDLDHQYRESCQCDNCRWLTKANKTLTALA
ncbi:hypothetical protein [Paraferrimonas sedimenticola]|uniref:Uncharacterized protein n=1 Tax=Paraferrimonas sedimenticola TaxID=375674 RepID=A0AA37RX60_9GAMM|nr:hypothetical protein [Paraferrimonas sedimenticola]GLP97295.1 hypothetical protein GCM10007895_26020 [Paraferrimonas sedimenticola]